MILIILKNNRWKSILILPTCSAWRELSKYIYNVYINQKKFLTLTLSSQVQYKAHVKKKKIFLNFILIILKNNRWKSILILPTCSARRELSKYIYKPYINQKKFLTLTLSSQVQYKAHIKKKFFLKFWF